MKKKKAVLTFPSNKICPICGVGGYVRYMENSKFIAKCTNCNHYFRKDDFPMCVLDKTEKKEKTNRERFDDLRRRLWELLGHVNFSDGCKSYEGAIEIHVEYPDYFFCLDNNDDKPQIPSPSYYEITLHCYVLGPSRHYKFKGKTFSQALDEFEKWIAAEESEERMNDD